MAIRLCPKCNGKVSTTRNDCPHCGYVFEENKKCPECDEFIAADMKECPVCGYLFTDEKKENFDTNSNINENNVVISNNQDKNLEQKSNLECPYCGSNIFMTIGINYNMCVVCKNKFLDFYGYPNTETKKSVSLKCMDEGENLNSIDNKIINDEINNTQKKSKPVLVDKEINVDSNEITNDARKAKKKKKKVLFISISLAFIAVIIILIWTVFIPAFSKNYVNINNMIFVKDGASNATLKEYKGDDTELVIPNEVKIKGTTCLVTRIDDYTFENCSSLTSITIPNSVTSIGNYAFIGCGSLTSITIPNSVTSIDDGAFRFCTSLTSITIPNSVTSIGGEAFYNCNSLTSITIPNSVTSIGYYAFSYCTSLTSITIPNSVTSIGGEAFYNCNSLTNITIPNSVTSIDDNTFSGCTSLTSITIPDSVTNIGFGAFSLCVSLSKVYYTSTLEEWNNISIINTNNTDLKHAKRYYYSKNDPLEDGNYWYYDYEGNIVEW